MSSCEGRGNCITQCSCDCYHDEECEIPSENCSCGHRNHVQGYCKVDCPHNCELVECHNYRMCGKKRPQNILDCHNGMCMDCAVSFGKIKFLDEKDDCPICLVNKDMIQVTCGRHKVCIECWKNWSETSTQIPLTCHLCREPIWR